MKTILAMLFSFLVFSIIVTNCDSRKEFKENRKGIDISLKNSHEKSRHQRQASSPFKVCQSVPCERPEFYPKNEHDKTRLKNAPRQLKKLELAKLKTKLIMKNYQDEVDRESKLYQIINEKMASNKDNLKKTKGDPEPHKESYRRPLKYPEWCNGPPGPPGIQGVQGVAGVQGVQGLTGVPGRVGRPGDTGEQGRRGMPGEAGKSPKNLQVAFSATMESNLPSSFVYRIVKFENVLLNVGGHYDPSTGKFTAPANATYLFGMNGVSHNGEDVLLHMVSNGKRIFSAFDSSGCGTGQKIQDKLRCSGSASNTGIVSLRKDEQVWVDLPDSYGLHNAPFHHYASFYGHLLFEQ